MNINISLSFIKWFESISPSLELDSPNKRYPFFDNLRLESLAMVIGCYVCCEKQDESFPKVS